MKNKKDCVTSILILQYKRKIKQKLSTDGFIRNFSKMHIHFIKMFI